MKCLKKFKQRFALGGGVNQDKKIKVTQRVNYACGKRYSNWTSLLLRLILVNKKRKR